MLHQLSYGLPISFFRQRGRSVGLEPDSPGSTARCSVPSSYGRHVFPVLRLVSRPAGTPGPPHRESRLSRCSGCRAPRRPVLRHSS